jgi:competence protein ComEC
VIRRHITPALAAFLLLLACCAARPLVGGAWWVALACSAAAAAAAMAFSRPGSARLSVLLFSASAGLLAGAVTLCRLDDASAGSFLPAPAEQVTTFRGTVAQDSSLTRTGDTVVRVSLQEAASARAGISGPARGAVLLFVPGDYRFFLGERLLVTARLSPFPSAGPETFSADVSRSGVRQEGYEGRIWEMRAAARAWVHRAVADAGYPASALMEALLIGVREDVPAEMSSSFLRTGSLHILALSGLHVTVLYGAIALFLGFVRRRWLKFALATLVLLFYQALAGFMPSLLRATVMILAAGTAALLDRDAEPLNALSLSGIVLVLIDPFTVFTVSFQLSFLAMAGILVVGPLVQRPLEGRLPRLVLVPLAMSVGAQAGTLPLVAAAFGAWYPSGIIAGLILVPLTTGLLWAGLAWLPVSLIPLPFLHDACVRVFSVLYRLIQGTADLFARLPGLVFAPGALPWVTAGCAAALVFLGTVLPSRAVRLHTQA